MPPQVKLFQFWVFKNDLDETNLQKVWRDPSMWLKKNKSDRGSWHTKNIASAREGF